MDPIPSIPSWRVRHLRLHRALSAVAVSLIVGSAIFAASASVGGLFGGELPEAFGVADVQANDAGVYSYQLVLERLGRDEVLFAGDEAVRFNWSGPRELLDNQGRPRVAQALQHATRAFEHAEGGIPLRFSNRTSDISISEWSLFDASDRAHVAKHEVHESTSARWESSEAGYVEVKGIGRMNRTILADADAGTRGSEAFCGLAHALQGRKVDPRKDLVLAARCTAVGESFRNLTVRGFQRLTMEEDQCLLFRQSTGETDARIAFVFCERSSYPIRVEVEHLLVPKLKSIYTLKPIRTGSGAVFVEDRAPSVPSGYELQWAPTQPWGPDDTGVPHPFPLSEAFRKARDDPKAPDLRDFLRGHPAAFVQRVGFDEGYAGNLTSWAWLLRVQDGAGTEWLEANVDAEGDIANDSDLEIRTEFVRHLTRLPGSPPMGPESVAAWRPPQRMPTVASMIAAARAHLPPVFPNATASWGFEIHPPGCDVIPVVNPERCRLAPTGTTYSMGFEHGFWTPRAPGATQNNGSLELWESEMKFDSSGPMDPRADVTWIEDRYVIEQRQPTSAPPPQAIRSQVEMKPSDPASHEPGTAIAVARPPRFDPPPTALWATVIGLMVGLVSFAWPALQRGASLLLFSRIEADTALEHPVRARVAALIEAEPGIHFQGIVRQTEASRTTVEHHLRKLMEVGLIHQVVGNGLACYFPKGRFDRRLMRAAPFAKAPTTRAFLSHVVSEPGLTAGGLAGRLGLDAGTVSYHLGRLHRVGLVRVDRDGREVHLFPTDWTGPALSLGRSDNS